MKLMFAIVLAWAIAGQQAFPPAPRLERIEMETSSWGRPVASWSIDAQGNGRYTVPEPGVFDAKQLVTRSFAAGTKGFREVRVRLGLAEHKAGSNLPCSNRITDAPYGQVRWLQPSGRSMQLRFDSGCQNRAARDVIADLQKADAMIAGWAKAGPVVETRAVERQ